MPSPISLPPAPHVEFGGEPDAPTDLAGLAHDLRLVCMRISRRVRFEAASEVASHQFSVCLSYLPRALGQTRSNTYMGTGGMDRLASGLLSFDTRGCSNGDPAPPAQTGTPELMELALLAQQYAFRTTGRDVARPPCVGQGNFPGYSTQFPQLEPEP